MGMKDYPATFEVSSVLRTPRHVVIRCLAPYRVAMRQVALERSLRRTVRGAGEGIFLPLSLF